MSEPADERTIKPDLIVDAEAIIERASAEISRLCAGRGGKTRDGLAGRDWTMCVPVQADDSDMVFSALLNLARHQREQLAASRSPGGRDTERLDWLGRDFHLNGFEFSQSRDGENPRFRLNIGLLEWREFESFRAAIDAAMSATEETTP